MSMLNIRPAVEGDLPAITEIYNQAILNTTATFDTEAKTAGEQKAWFDRHGGKYPLLVAELDGQVVGWASLSQYSDRCAYSETAEGSLYVKEGCRGQGTGRRLTAGLLAAGEKAGLHTVILRITEGNQASLDLAASFGFEPVGVMKEVGCKFDRRLDVHILQKIF
jgi:L-amino acid N-acyltransferase